VGQFLDDFATRKQKVPDLQIPESVGELHDLSLLRIQGDAETLADDLDRLQALLKVCLVVMNQVSVIVVSSVILDASAFLDVVIEPICGCQSQYLADLASKAKSNITECINEVFGQLDDSLICELFSNDLFDQSVRHTVEKLREIIQQDVSFVTMLPIILMQMLSQPL